MPRENGSSIWFDGSFSFLIPLQHEWIVWLVGTASEKQIAKATQGLRAYCGKNLGGGALDERRIRNDHWSLI